MTVERVKRKLAAIVATDVVGYARLMGADEVGTLAALKQRRAEVIDPQIARHDGRVVKLMGDGVLAEFASVVDAVESALAIQREMAAQNTNVSPATRINLRIGIHLGDVILDGDDIYGDGVNVAARLESIAEPGGICISSAVREAVGNKLPVNFVDLGERHVKNIEAPVRVYGLLDEGQRAVPERATPAKSAQRGHENPSLAVKPFENLSNDPEQDQVADGLSNGILTALTRVPRLMLVQDESHSLQKTKDLTLQELGRLMDVQYVLKGSLRKLGDQTRVSVELVKTTSGQIVWAEQFDWGHGDIRGLFGLQDEITEEIVAAMEVKLLYGDAARYVRSSFKNSAARQSYYDGEALLWSAQSRLELRDAQRLLEDAIRLEPTCSVGYATAALAYWMETLGVPGEPDSQATALAVQRSQEALRLGDVTGFPHMVMAHIHLGRREYDEAAAEADNAVSARPSCPASYALKAAVLNFLGRAAEAVEHAQYAIRLTPVHPPLYPAVLASALYGSRRYEEAAAEAKTAIELDDQHTDPYLMLAASSIALGATGDAEWARDRVSSLKPEFKLADLDSSMPYEDPANLQCLKDLLKEAGFQ